MRFSKDSELPEGLVWKTYRKVALTKATKIDGPFEVETSEGPLSCKGGFLCLDARGYPYPVATEEFNLIYVETGIEDDEACDPA